MSAYTLLRGMVGENTEIPIFAVPALPGGEKPVWILFKIIAEVAASYGKSVVRPLYLIGSVYGFYHLKNPFLKADFSVKII